MRVSLAGPTTCWKYDWNDLESNHQRFRALNRYLHERKLLMLVKTDHDSEGQSSIPSGCSQLSGHFVVYPTSQDGTMLIKSVACREILVRMPASAFEVDGDVPHEVTEDIRRNMDRFKAESLFNPMYIESGLYAYLTGILRKIRPPNKPTIRSLMNQLTVDAEYNPSGSNLAGNSSFSGKKQETSGPFGEGDVTDYPPLGAVTHGGARQKRPKKTFVPSFVTASDFMRGSK